MLTPSGITENQESWVLHLTSYSITLSLRSNSVDSTVRSSALAAFRLMTNSNLIGCWTCTMLLRPDRGQPSTLSRTPGAQPPKLQLQLRVHPGGSMTVPRMPGIGASTPFTCFGRRVPQLSRHRALALTGANWSKCPLPSLLGAISDRLTDVWEA